MEREKSISSIGKIKEINLLKSKTTKRLLTASLDVCFSPSVFNYLSLSFLS